jgi:hypothetical protein
MRVLDTSALATALRFADTLAISDRESTLVLQVALVSFSVLAIDGEPLYEVFEVPLVADEVVTVEGKVRPIFPPLSPPQRVRVLSATLFMDFLNVTATGTLLEELWRAYNEEVDPKGTLKALLENKEKPEEDEVPLP